MSAANPVFVLVHGEFAQRNARPIAVHFGIARVLDVNRLGVTNWASFQPDSDLLLVAGKQMSKDTLALLSDRATVVVFACSKRMANVSKGEGAGGSFRIGAAPK